MINRVSTASQYQSLTSNLMRKQGELNTSNEHLATGRRVLTAGDDPVSSVMIQNYRQEQTLITQYQDAITLATNRMNVTESTLTGVENNLDVTKQKVIRMINGAMAAEDRSAFKDELQSLYDELLGLANTQDESGNYIFAGTQSATKPFMQNGQTPPTIVYQGDDQARHSQIDKNLEVKTSLTGNDVFMAIPNPYGDYRPDFSGLQPDSQLHILTATNSNPNDSNNYSVKFVDNAGVMEYQLYQGDPTTGVLLDQNTYDPKVGVNFDLAAAGGAGTLDFQFDGEIKLGDSVALTPSKTFNVLDSLKDAINNAEQPTSSAEGNANLQRVIDDLNGAFIHMNQQRSQVGSVLQTLDRQGEQHKDFELTLNKAQSGLEDLDYSKAIIDMNEQSMALQASQAAFNKTKELTLFNYL
ncbi:flagellar hook-associated protein FlgL [Photobacterium sp. GB-56]|uniref:flagellar hook-associated protein FlgL n=1 Tax=Photobacterium sp. GB-56 TaxID=2022106 RepID=UPI000D182F67|nr:flagellar hook-associated protein FlgL [Photobacterium sp. GB-56]PSV28749.1 flagellar hook-associated protein 3 [Photobacterium sp. GB-56]